MLKVENISLTYSDGTQCLTNINLTIPDGKVVLLTGESGCGKSSLISSINGLSYHYNTAHLTGKITLNNIPLQSLQLYEISKYITTLFQNPKTHFFNVNTTLELLFYLENIGLSRKQMQERLDDLRKVLPIQHLLNRDIFALSGGEKQILSIASCYISGCPMIVMDEPSSNLDEKTIIELKKILRILKEKGITLIIAEHRLYYLMDIVDTIYLLDHGKLINTYTTSQFLSLNSHELHRLGLRSTSQIPLLSKPSPQGKDYFIHLLKHSFPTRKTLLLKNIGFDCGKIYGIVGNNGCGKSTFINILCGLMGKCEVTLDSKKIHKKNRLKISSLVMQDVNRQLFTDDVVAEVTLGVKNIREETIDSILSSLNLLPYKHQHPMSLSGGQKQRVAIASLMCQKANFIFFDEPTSGMDYQNMLKISNVIKKLSNQDNIIFIVSHDTEFLNVTVDSILHLEDYIIY